MARRQQKPAGVVVIAILQIVFGSLGLISPVLYFAGAQKAMASWQASMPKAPNQPDFSQAKFQAEIEHRLPWYTAFMTGLNAFALVLCLLMLAGGIGLLQMQGWARWLTVFYALLSILYTIASTIIMVTSITPAMADVMVEQMKRMQPPGGGPGPNPEALANFMRIAMTAGSVLALLLLVYPIIVLVIMLLPSTRAAFRGEALGAEPEDYRDEGWDERREPPDEGYRPARE